MRIFKIGLLVTLGVFSLKGLYAAGPAFDIIPLWDIKVNYEGLQYSNISVKTADASAIVRNNIPQNLKFTIALEKPKGFSDSAGKVYYGAEVSITKGSSKSVTYTKDYFNGAGMSSQADLNEIALSWTFDAQTTVGTKINIAVKVFDRIGNGYVSYNYNFIVVAASKRLPNKIVGYSNKDSKGMRANSVGLHFNFFEFSGMSGNNFIYKLKKGEKFAISLKGLEGWKLADGKAEPNCNIIFYNADGIEIESNADPLDQKSIPATKKELEMKHKFATNLESGKMYFALIMLTDKNSPKNELALVVKFYIE